jgi:hypothetical protein
MAATPARRTWIRVLPVVVVLAVTVISAARLGALVVPTLGSIRVIQLRSHAPRYQDMTAASDARRRICTRFSNSGCR